MMVKTGFLWTKTEKGSVGYHCVFTLAKIRVRQVISPVLLTFTKTVKLVLLVSDR